MSKLESDFQSTVKKWLVSRGCVVQKLTPGSGVSTGFPDLLFLKEGFWGCLECKQSKDAPHRPGQDRWIERLNDMSYARFVYPENWDEVKAELDVML